MHLECLWVKGMILVMNSVALCFVSLFQQLARLLCKLLVSLYCYFMITTKSVYVDHVAKISSASVAHFLQNSVITSLFPWDIAACFTWAAEQVLRRADAFPCACKGIKQIQPSERAHTLMDWYHREDLNSGQVWVEGRLCNSELRSHINEGSGKWRAVPGEQRKTTSAETVEKVIPVHLSGLWSSLCCIQTVICHSTIYLR